LKELNSVNAGSGSRVDVTGGEVGSNLEAVAAEVNITSGSVGDYFDAFDGTTVVMTGGELGYAGHVDGGSTFQLSGGLARGLTATRGSTINISGGESLGVVARDNADIVVSGGTVTSVRLENSEADISGGVVLGAISAGVGSRVTLRGGRFGDGFSTTSSGSVTIEGAEFYLDGVPIAGLYAPGDAVTAITVLQDSVLSGTLADGTTFAFGKGFRTSDSFAEGSVALEFVEPPAVGLDIITVPTDPAPFGIRGGQTLIVEAGGSVPDNVTAGVGSRVEVREGGMIGANFEAVGSTVLVEGGSIGPKLDIFAGTTLTMTDGVLGAGSSSPDSVNVFGGTLNLHGGTIGPALIANDGANVNLFGYGFAINGVPIEGLVTDEAFTVVDRGGANLTGYFEDGSLFNFQLQESSGRIFDAFSADTLLTVTVVEGDSLAGDFNTDGKVNGLDFLQWQRGESPYPLSNTDRILWESTYGANSPPEASATVPEPTSHILSLTAFCLMIARFRFRIARGKKTE